MQKRMSVTYYKVTNYLLHIKVATTVVGSRLAVTKR